jgi:hypothetical protein
MHKDILDGVSEGLTKKIRYSGVLLQKKLSRLTSVNISNIGGKIHACQIALGSLSPFKGQSKKTLTVDNIIHFILS